MNPLNPCKEHLIIPKGVLGYSESGRCAVCGEIPPPTQSEGWRERFQKKFLKEDFHGFASLNVTAGELAFIADLEDFISQEIATTQREIVEMAEGMKQKLPNTAFPPQALYNQALTDLQEKLKGKGI